MMVSLETVMAMVVATVTVTGKNNGFPFLDILGYLKNTHKNPKFGKVRQVPTREFPTKFPDWDLSHSSKFGILWVFFKYPKISKNGNPLLFPVSSDTYSKILLIQTLRGP